MLFKIKIVIVFALIFSTFFLSCTSELSHSQNLKHSVMIPNKNSKLENPYYSNTDTQKLNVSDSEWKKILMPEVYEISRNAHTEAPYTGKYCNTNTKGTYYCAACGNKLFRSDTKFNSSCGWPSFFEQATNEAIIFKPDHSLGMQRIEALCGRCGGHLGHLFDDGPAPTGKRYCMNSAVLDFVPDNSK